MGLNGGLCFFRLPRLGLRHLLAALHIRQNLLVRLQQQPEVMAALHEKTAVVRQVVRRQTGRKVCTNHADKVCSLPPRFRIRRRQDTVAVAVGGGIGFPRRHICGIRFCSPRTFFRFCMVGRSVRGTRINPDGSIDGSTDGSSYNEPPKSEGSWLKI